MGKTFFGYIVDRSDTHSFSAIDSRSFSNIVDGFRPSDHLQPEAARPVWKAVHSI